MGNSAASNESIYQAALITEQRQLQGRQDALDIMQRLLAQMGDDPLLVQTKANLTKILENPEVITDEVFNNIMSKTGEILDTNYDQQVQEVLGAARSKGVSGPALQVTLQKAKEARASAMATAYRDAIIERANSGLKTNMDAITSASNLLINLFGQQRVLTTDIANVMRETVDAPFRNYGVDDVQAGQVGGGGGGGGGGGSGSVVTGQPSDYKLGDWSKQMAEEQAKQLEAEARANDLAVAKSQAEFDAYWAKWGVNGTAAQKAKEQAAAGNAAAAKAAVAPGTPGLPVPLDTSDQKLADQGPASGTGTFEMNGKKYTIDEKGNIKQVDYTNYDESNRTPYINVARSNVNPLSPATPEIPSLQTAQPTAIQSAVQSAMAPLKAATTSVANQFEAPVSNLAAPKILGPAYNNGQPYSESTLTSPAGTLSAGGGAQEASRGAALVQQYGMDKVVGTAAGYGVKSGDIAGYGGAGTGYATPTGSASPGAYSATPAKKSTSPGQAIAEAYNQDTDPYGNVATGSQSAGAYSATSAEDAKAKKDYGDNFMGWGESSIYDASGKIVKKRAMKINTGTGENYGKSWMYVNVE
jgi:hypothetical protein